MEIIRGLQSAMSEHGIAAMVITPGADLRYVAEYDAKRGAVKWKSDLLFALGSDIVRDSAKPSLQAFSKIAKSSAAAQFDVIVVGHTCNLRIAKESTRRLHPTNWHLSAHRAISVNSLLMGYGVPKTRTGVVYRRWLGLTCSGPTGNERSFRECRGSLSMAIARGFCRPGSGSAMSPSITPPPSHWLSFRERRKTTWWPSALWEEMSSMGSGGEKGKSISGWLRTCDASTQSPRSPRSR